MESFGEAFAIHEECFSKEMDVVKKWIKALVLAGNVSGHDLHSVMNGYSFHKSIYLVFEGDLPDIVLAGSKD
ncbi:unnamed protein product [Dovyalis caffra]|uniref:Uncharacterized protein n=1 Tax=Dovyalis caffra TaxID=77055 RepID=A0AAV1QWV4_9ROSI|nr:unnamed protein product [Dovyalis caffra]